jgi:hypothetical protein
MIESPEREIDKGIAPVIAGKLDSEPHLSVQKLARFFGHSAIHGLPILD